MRRRWCDRVQDVFVVDRESDMAQMKKFLFALLLLALPFGSFAQMRLTLVELNAENMFDIRHDSLKNDEDFLPNGTRHWTQTRYWAKLNNISKVILSCGKDSMGWVIPDIVGLCEVENDTVLFDLTRRSLLRKARYEYVMTSSPDTRGIDVALLYSPFSFRLLRADTICVKPIRGMKPTRDILHVAGEVVNGDTLHVFLVHAPSRSGGELQSRPFRIHTAKVLGSAIDSIRAVSRDAKIIVMGDFNDYTISPALHSICEHYMTDVSAKAQGTHGAKATYRYQGEWRSLDHILLSHNLLLKVERCYVNDMPFLLEADTKYGGVKPRRNYNGLRYNGGFSDHLPLVLTLAFR